VSDTFSDAMRDVFNKLRGLNAIVALNTKSHEIVAAKNGSPLIVGIGENEYFLASDATGIIKYTKDVIFLEDNQMVVLSGNLRLFNLPEGEEITPKIHKLDWDFTEADKGDFPHFLIKEIHEQPKVVEHIALTYQEQTKNLANLIDKAFGTFMVGCGTASYAAVAGVYLFSSIAKKHVNFTIGSEFKYLEDYLTPKTLLIPISQSGETIDVIEPVQKAKQKGTQIAALVNVLGSTLYRLADHKILLGAGQEKAVVATKSFMAMYSILLMTVFALVKRQAEAEKMLIAASNNIKQLLTKAYEEQIKELAEKLKEKEHIYLLGRGLSYATAQEATLKIKESSYVHAECFAGGELKHGPIALIEKGTPCVIFAPNDETYEEIISNAQEVKARGGYIIGIGPKNNDVFDKFFQTDDVQEATLLPQIVVAQLFAYHLALARGIKDPDKPRNLAKSVTVK
jgi:glucosamine--fructose-6-phosphate aminotransferase (isomerizing)